ncbi:cupredoxin domain-containing protein [Haladaptatus caseinilyticus]|uniref:cupredoxin domain-containing protein n=1 Tax=Haladaptatus caseinilyticus TaxID=2993314 RepID=UPI00224B279D|nr:hypothetical protein [Haladaptatus caseinilyticus]
MNDYDSNGRQYERSGRRTFLGKLGGASVALGMCGLVAGQDGNGNGRTGAQTNQRTILLGAEVPGWEGRLPSSIENEQNPTLELQPGTRYKVAWINRDGAQHQLEILDNDENVLEQTESASERGVNLSVTFTATREMSQYRCRFHPESMRGDIEQQS